ncbi:hypothetical protein D3C84_855650 [compost metagenome]
MAIQTQAGFQAQGVAGAKTNRSDFWLSQQAAGQGVGLLGWNGNFEAVFTGVARAADVAVSTQQLHRLELHEGHFCYLWCQARQHGGRRRAL